MVQVVRGAPHFVEHTHAGLTFYLPGICFYLHCYVVVMVHNMPVSERKFYVICDFHGLRNSFGIEVILHHVVAFYFNLWRLIFWYLKEDVKMLILSSVKQLHCLLQLSNCVLLDWMTGDTYQMCWLFIGTSVMFSYLAPQNITIGKRLILVSRRCNVLNTLDFFLIQSVASSLYLFS